MENVFAEATRRKLKFDSPRGLINVEDLWDLPLLGRDEMNLNSIAKGIHKQIKETEGENFVEETTSTIDKVLETKLEVVKFIIEVKKKERDERKAAEENRAKKQRLLEILSEKKDEDLRNKSVDEIEKMINDL